MKVALDQMKWDNALDYLLPREVKVFFALACRADEDGFVHITLSSLDGPGLSPVTTRRALAELAKMGSISIERVCFGVHGGFDIRLSPGWVEFLSKENNAQKD